ncbi:MAG: hypothetical protein IJX02_08165 [Clostridia bacterium]|nr:hypothetical protein [Clostridia bacterium]
MQKTVLINSNNEIYIGKQKYTVDNFDLEFSVLCGDKYNLKVKRYPGGKYKKTYCNLKSFKVPFPHAPLYRQVNYAQFLPEKEREKYLKEKEKEACRRSIEAVKDISRLNPDLLTFVTFTIDPKTLDSSSPSEVYTKLKNFLSNSVQNKGLKYVFTSEYHKKDAKIHFHGLVNDKLTLVDSGTFKVKGFKKPMRLAKIIRKGLEAQIECKVYNVKEWKLGFSTAIKLEDNDKAVNYVTKYLLKELEDMEKKSYYPERPFERRYFSSKNIKRYPDIELHSVPYEEYRQLNVKEYENRYTDYKYKYIDNFTVKK